jgi:thioester reductase-like protein
MSGGLTLRHCSISGHWERQWNGRQLDAERSQVPDFRERRRPRNVDNQTQQRRWFAHPGAALLGVSRRRARHSGDRSSSCDPPADHFRAAVQDAKLGPEKNIPHISAPVIVKYATDLELLGLL